MSIQRHGTWPIRREANNSAKTRLSVNWQLMSHACACIGVPIATAYDTLGESGLTHSLKRARLRRCFYNAELLPTLSKILVEHPTVRLVVYDGTPSAAELVALKSKREGVKVLSIDEVSPAWQRKDP